MANPEGGERQQLLSELKAAEFIAHFGGAEFGTGPYEAFLDHRLHLELSKSRNRAINEAARIVGKSGKSEKKIESRLDLIEISTMHVFYNLEIEKKMIGLKGYRATYASIDEWVGELLDAYKQDFGRPEWKNQDYEDYEDTEEYKKYSEKADSWYRRVIYETVKTLEKKAE